jgi:hypothetical protein
MLLAGNEIGDCQGGNNNAYAQDDPLGWIHWSAPDTELLDVVRRLVRVRRDQRRTQAAHLHARPSATAMTMSCGSGPTVLRRRPRTGTIGHWRSVLPDPGHGRSWRLEVDTARPDDDVSYDATYLALAQFVDVLAH